MAFVIVAAVGAGAAALGGAGYWIARSIGLLDTPLQAAVRKGDPGAVRAVVGRSRSELRGSAADGGHNIFHFAARYCTGGPHVDEVVGALAEAAGGDRDNLVNTRTVARWLLAGGLETPLHVAAAAGNADTVRALARVGADVNRVDGQGLTPLHRAAEAGKRLDALLSLVAAGASVSAGPNGLTPLHVAVTHGNTRGVAALAPLSDPGAVESSLERAIGERLDGTADSAAVVTALLDAHVLWPPALQRAGLRLETAAAEAADDEARTARVAADARHAVRVAQAGFESRWGTPFEAYEQQQERKSAGLARRSGSGGGGGSSAATRRSAAAQEEDAAALRVLVLARNAAVAEAEHTRAAVARANELLALVLHALVNVPRGSGGDGPAASAPTAPAADDGAAAASAARAGAAAASTATTTGAGTGLGGLFSSLFRGSRTRQPASSSSAAVPPPTAPPADDGGVGSPARAAPAGGGAGATAAADGSDAAAAPSCPICLDAPKDTAITPCGHTLCAECARGLVEAAGGTSSWPSTRAACPVCRGRVVSTMRIYL